MKICLVRPNEDKNVKHSNYAHDCDPPIFLGYVSTALKQAGYDDVCFVDARLDDLDPHLAAAAVLRKMPNLIVVQSYVGYQHWIRTFASCFPYMKAELLFAGPLITTLKEHAMKFIDADYGIVGEYENGVVDFVRYMEGEITLIEVEGLIWKAIDGNIYACANVPYGSLKNLDDVPMQDWGLLQPARYRHLAQGATIPLRGKRQAALLVVRGCPFRCTFCFCDSVIMNRGKVKYRSIESVIDEMKYLKENFGVDEIVFTDDALNFDMDWLKKLCSAMIVYGFNFHWRSPKGLRADYLDEKLVSLMALSGCYYVGIGVESGNQAVVDRMNKKLDLNCIKKAIDLLHKYNIIVQGFFMLGNPGETVEEIKDSIKFSLDIPFDRIQVSNFIPFPGSMDFENMFRVPPDAYEKMMGWYLKNEWTPKYSDIPLKKIYRMQRNWMLRFYLRPRILFSMLRRLRFSQLKSIWRHQWVQNWIKK